MSQPDLFAGEVQCFERRILRLLDAEAVRHLPDFVGVVVVDDGARAERKIVYAGNEMSVEHRQIAGEFGQAAIAAMICILSPVLIAYSFSASRSRRELPAWAVDVESSRYRPVAAFFVALLIVRRLAGHFGQTIRMQIE